MDVDTGGTFVQWGRRIMDSFRRRGCGATSLGAIAFFAAAIAMGDPEFQTEWREIWISLGIGAAVAAVEGTIRIVTGTLGKHTSLSQQGHAGPIGIGVLSAFLLFHFAKEWFLLVITAGGGYLVTLGLVAFFFNRRQTENPR